MNVFRKLFEYLFPYGSGDIGLLLPAIATAALSSGIVAICLWIVHSPSTLLASDAVEHDCLKHCEKVCGGQTR